MCFSLLLIVIHTNIYTLKTADRMPPILVTMDTTSNQSYKTALVHFPKISCPNSAVVKL